MNLYLLLRRCCIGICGRILHSGLVENAVCVFVCFVCLVGGCGCGGVLCCTLVWDVCCGVSLGGWDVWDRVRKREKERGEGERGGRVRL